MLHPATQSIDVAVRLATEADSDLVYEWRNDPVSREMSRVGGAVPWPMHASWFADALESPTRILMICAHDFFGLVGVVRFDLQQRDTWAEISINLNPHVRGNGLAPKCLNASVALLNEDYPDCRRFVAEIKKINKASLKTFERAGFTKFDSGDVYETYMLALGADS